MDCIVNVQKNKWAVEWSSDDVETCNHGISEEVKADFFNITENYCPTQCCINPVIGEKVETCYIIDNVVEVIGEYAYPPIKVFE